MDISAWLRGLGLERYEQAFRENAIDEAILPKLTAEDFRDLGVMAVGHRRILLDAIAASRTEIFRDPTERSVESDRSFGRIPEAERRQLTVMFADLVGSTALSTRLDPEDLRAVIGAYHKCVADIVAQFDGFVAKYMGDGVLAYFGYPQAHEDDAERAVGCALALIEEVPRLRTDHDAALQVRIGISTGLVVVGDLIGEGVSQEHGVVGDTPNLAARLQSLAGPGSVVISESTRRITGGLFNYRDLGTHDLKGFAGPVRAWQALGASAAESRFEAQHEAGLTSLVGRDEELELILRWWQHVQDGEGRVIFLSGEAGIGKSRLSRAFEERLRGEPHTRLRYFCSAHHKDSALHPFTTQLERAAGFTREDAPEARLAKLEALLAQSTTRPEEIALIVEQLSLPTCGRHRLPELSPQLRKEKTLQALLAQLSGLAVQRPVLMLFEDAHWVDPTSLELLRLAIELVQRLPVLLIITARPGFTPPWPGYAHLTMLSLTRLNQREAAALVSRVAGGKALPDEVMKQILARADGVPLFVEELTKTVLESGLLRERDGRYVLSEPLSSMAIPTTLQASLLARLDRLAPAREIAQIGAALGRSFSHELVSAVAPMPQLRIDDALAQLVSAELIFSRGTPPDAEYTFKHALVQDAAYSTLLRSRRQELHARIGKVLEKRFPDTVDMRPEIVAYHFTQAGLVEPAIEYWRRAGTRSVNRFDHSEAASHFASALDLLRQLLPSEQRDERELELRLSLAVPLIAAYGFGSARVEECALGAKDLSDKLPDSPKRFAAQRAAWNSCVMRQPVEKTIALARNLFELADHDKDDAAKRAVAHRALGYSLFISGEMGGGAEILARGAALADGCLDDKFAIYGEHPSMICRLYEGQSKILMGFPDTGMQLIDAAVAHARLRKNPHSLAWALAVGAHAFQTQHETTTAARFASEAIETARGHRLPQWLALGERVQGWAMHQLGDREAGLSLQQEGIRRWYETGAKLHTTHCEIYLTESYLREDQAVTAQTHIDRARMHCGSYGENYLASEICRLEGLILQRKGVPVAAVEQVLANAIHIARQQKARLLELRSATTLARVLIEKGERTEARDLLAPIYGWFIEGFATRDLKEADALLSELA
jgi:class 3 adenylate cyclase